MKVLALGEVGAVSPGRVPGGTLAWRAVVRVLRSPVAAAEDVLTSVFPGDCRVCGGPLLFAMRGGAVCGECVGAVRPQQRVLCGCCGEAMEMDEERYLAGAAPAEGMLCAGCRLVPPEFVRAVAYGVYEAELRRMIHLLKYEGVRSLAPVLGGMLARAVDGLPDAGGMAVVAVPLFPAKERMRGYNQAVLLADAAARALPARKLEAAHGVLRRVRDTESQFALTPTGRRRNIRGAFAVLDAARVSGREVLLVDDIYTTGATARECARVLRGAGAAKVWVATLARAQVEEVARWESSR